jgi:hypothetical protein
MPASPETVLAALSTDFDKYVGHFIIDVLATLATLYAQRFFTRPSHRFLIWLLLSIVVTVSTVNLVG